MADILHNGPITNSLNNGRAEGDVQPIDGLGYAEMGVTGLKRASRYVYEEYIPTLKGERAAKIYQEMRENDPVIGAILFAIDMLLRQVDWRIAPFDQSEQGQQDQEFLEGCLEDMSTTWAETISEILGFLPFGYSYHEIVYKKRVGPSETDPRMRSKFTDAKIGWRKLPGRAQDTNNGWEFAKDGGVKGMYQLAPPDYKEVFIPIEKSLLFRTGTHKGNPEGRSVLRNAYEPWYYKKRISEFEGIGIERDLAGIPIAFVDPQIMRADANAADQAIYQGMKTLVQSVRRDKNEGIIFPRAYDANGHLIYDFQLLSTGGSRQFDTDKVITRYDQRIAMTVLADFILLGHDKVGSFALSSDKTDLFAIALGSWLDAIAEVFNSYAIPRLWEVNGWPSDKLPTLEHGDIESPDLTALADYVSKLTAAGVPLFPDPELEDFLREAAHLPEKAEDLKALDEQMAAIQRETQLAQRKQQKDMAENPAKYAQMFGGAVAPATGSQALEYRQRQLPRDKGGAQGAGGQDQQNAETAPLPAAQGAPVGPKTEDPKKKKP